MKRTIFGFNLAKLHSTFAGVAGPGRALGLAPCSVPQVENSQCRYPPDTYGDVVVVQQTKAVVV